MRFIRCMACVLAGVATSYCFGAVRYYFLPLNNCL